jgi:hypothetical protein
MQFNSHATNQDICTLANDLVKQSSTSFPIEQKVRFANQGNKEILTWICEAYGGWHYDDSNNDDLPEILTTLNSGKRFYTLPVDSSAVMGVEFKDEAGIWTKLEPITLEQIQDRAGSETEWNDTPSFPIYHRLTANGLYLYPVANYTQALSLKVYISRDVVLFTTTDTTKTPGFDSRFHEAVAVYMALQFSFINSLPVYQALFERWTNYEKRIKKYYATRFKEMFPPRMTVSDSVREYS